MDAAWDDLSPQRRQALEAMLRQPRPLVALIRTPLGGSLRACDYLYFLQQKWIAERRGQVWLTKRGEAVQQDMIRARRRWQIGRFKAGDMATIRRIQPVFGHHTNVRYWRADAYVDGSNVPYNLTIWPEDFEAMRAAGYRVPNFQSRQEQPVAWEVYVSTEQDAKTGWRIADVVEHQAKP